MNLLVFLQRVRGCPQFYDQWLAEFPWLCFEGGMMFCTVCMPQDSSTSGQFDNDSEMETLYLASKRN